MIITRNYSRVIADLVIATRGNAMRTDMLIIVYTLHDVRCATTYLAGAALRALTYGE